jgi:hypothetical protein
VPLLSVNHEARNEFLLASHRIFNPERFTIRAAELRFNFETDSIYWNLRHPFLYYTPEKREKNTSASFPGWDMRGEVFELCSVLVQKHLKSIAGDTLRDFHKFVALEEVIFVFADDLEDDPATDDEDDDLKERLVGWKFDNYQVTNRIGMMSAHNFKSLQESDYWIKKGTEFRFAEAVREPL